MKQISCTNCTIIHVKETCPFVTPWKFKHFLCCRHYINTYLGFFRTDLKDSFLGPSENQHLSSIYFHRTFSRPNIISSSHFVFQWLSTWTCLLLCSLPIDCLSFNNHAFRDKPRLWAGLPYTCGRLHCQIFPLSPSTPFSSFWEKILVMEPLFFSRFILYLICRSYCCFDVFVVAVCIFWIMG